MTKHYNNLIETLSLSLLILFSFWWIILFFGYGSAKEHQNLIWAASYQSIAIWGVIWGIIAGKKWGGRESIMGRAIFLLSLGLLFQTLGQSIFSIHGLFLNTDIPYPSLADLGFFGSIPLYIFGVIELGKAAGVTSIVKSFKKNPLALLLPLAMLLLSYYFFLQGYVFEWSNPLRVILDLGYPLGQATFVSLSILVYILSKNTLGGIMRSRILIILVALLIQYLSDFNFLFQFQNGTWLNGGYGDMLYMVSYFLMGYGLIKIGTILSKIKES